MAAGADQTNLGAANSADQFNMGIAQGMDQNQQAALGNLQNMQQGAMNQFNPAMVGQQMAGTYAQTIGGPTVLGNSSSQGNSFNNSNAQGSSFNNSNAQGNSFSNSNAQGSSSNNASSQGNSFNNADSQGASFNNANSNNFGTNMGFSNGMNIGMNQSGGFNNGYGYGASNGSGSSSSWSFDPGSAMQGAGAMGYSDARLKRNIERVDSVDGVNLYTWDWHKDAPVTSPMNYGVMAQEVAETHPEAVTTGEHGYMVVDYNKLGRAGEMALARMEG